MKINSKPDKKITKLNNSNTKRAVFEKKVNFIRKSKSKRKIPNFTLNDVKYGKNNVIRYPKKQKSDANNKSMKSMMSICTLSTNYSKNDNVKTKPEKRLSYKFLQAQEKWQLNYWVSVIQKVFRGYYYRKYIFKKLNQLKQFGVLSSDNIFKNKDSGSIFPLMSERREKRKIKEIVIVFKKKSKK